MPHRDIPAEGGTPHGARQLGASMVAVMPGQDTPNRHGGPCELQPAMAVSPLAEAGADVGHDPANLEHDELVLLANLSNTNTRIAHYIARVLNLDQGHTKHTTALTVVERELAEHLVATGHSLLAHSHCPHLADTRAPERDEA
jgi:hypothetical protein